MTTLLDKTLTRDVRVRDRSYVVAISPLTLKLTPKGKRRGVELQWEALVSGDAALAAALNASVGKFTPQTDGSKRGDPSVGPTSSKNLEPRSDSAPRETQRPPAPAMPPGCRA